VLNLELNGGANSITNLTVNANNASKANISVKAKVYVLATGGIENARLLLSSNNVNPLGVGNNNKLVGRFFQGHGYLPTLNNTIYLSLNEGQNLDGYDNHQVQGINTFKLLRLSEKIQKQNRLLNSYVAINTGGWSFPIEQTPENNRIKLEYFKLLRVLNREHPVKWHAVFAAMLFEQEPNFQSKVFLVKSRDWLGIRKVNVRGMVSRLQLDTVIGTYKEIGNVLGENFRGRVKFSADKRVVFEKVHDSLAKHHIGTTRMHNSSNFGVVNSNCRSHFVDNLYVIGSSVFPTGSATNPTFTIIALSIRLADHLKKIILL